MTGDQERAVPAELQVVGGRFSRGNLQETLPRGDIEDAEKSVLATTGSDPSPVGGDVERSGVPGVRLDGGNFT